MGMQSEIHWQGNRNSWECSLRFIGMRFIGRGIGTQDCSLSLESIDWGIGSHGNAV